MKILILGHKGMLGHMVNKFFLTKKDVEITTTETRWPTEEFKNEITTTETRWPTEEFKNEIINFDGDFIINCIGAIHQRTKQFEVNWELPEFLDINAKCKVVHPGTDCEMDDDPYGVSKKIARDFIVEKGTRTKSLKTSIIGPELSTKASLMYWFLSQPDESTVKGFSEYYWNGNTTLTWAKECYNLILNWDKYNTETIAASDCISKYEILVSISEVFNKQINIVKQPEPVVNKCLVGVIKTPHIKEQLIELKNFMENEY